MATMFRPVYQFREGNRIHQAPLWIDADLSSYLFSLATTATADIISKIRSLPVRRNEPERILGLR